MIPCYEIVIYSVKIEKRELFFELHQKIISVLKENKSVFKSEIHQSNTENNVFVNHLYFDDISNAMIVKDLFTEINESKEFMKCIDKIFYSGYFLLNTTLRIDGR